ncbi:MAG: hypothetical protein Q8K02_04425 [Flavobacterium sp.]|jgi:hypothetical protein|nr:hypothetical protein [Flavobacterium sp.]
MKNIVLAGIACLAFSTMTQAQQLDTEMSAERKEILMQETLKSDMIELAEYVDFYGTQEENIKSFLQLRMEMLNDSSLSKEEKATLKKGLSKKFLSLLNEGQVEKLKTNKELYTKYVN